MSGEIIIFHNPNCGTSRNALAAIRAAGQHPNVVEYLKTGWTVQQLRQLLSEMKMSARESRARSGDRPPGGPRSSVTLSLPEL